MRSIGPFARALFLLGVAAGCGGRACAKSDPAAAGLPPGAVPVDSATAVASPVPTPPAPGAGRALADADPEHERAGAVKLAPVSFAPIAKRADKSVVTITTVGTETDPGGFGQARRETKGLGTGFVVDRAGVILTNDHVVDAAESITVKLSDERSFAAKVVGRDPPTDIALLRIDAHDLTPLVLGDSDGIEVGDWVVAIGNPFGLSHTVSAGIVSAKGRSKDDMPLEPTGYYDFLQTDASINPGNSGGPLLDLSGVVVGMNTAIRGGAQGIGFAIPINMIKQLWPMLLHDGHVTRSALGVRIQDVRDLAPEERAAYHVTVQRGACVESVNPHGPAEKVGLATGDVILAFDGEPIVRGTHLQWLASTAGVGRVVSLRVSRAGKLFDLKVTLGKLVDAPLVRSAAPLPPAPP